MTEYEEALVAVAAILLEAVLAAGAKKSMLTDHLRKCGENFRLVGRANAAATVDMLLRQVR